MSTLTWRPRCRQDVRIVKPIVVIGEAVADAFVETAAASAPAAAAGLALRVRPGGSPANTAVALARLGAPTRFLGRLSRGVLGELLLAHVAASRVDVSRCVRTDAPATLAITSVDASGRAVYDFYVDGTADRGWTGDELAERRPDDACAVHAGSLALVLPPGGPLIEDTLRAMRDRATISIDPNARPRLVSAETYRAHLPGWIGLADILRLSDEDLAYLMPGVSLDSALDAWHAAGVSLAVVTLGPAGALASLRGARVTAPAAPPPVLVDTVGAGDSFTAGLLHSLWRAGHLGGRLDRLQEADLLEAMTFAARVAGYTCGVAGADPPWAAQLADG
jgi:fructokinase